MLTRDQRRALREAAYHQQPHTIDAGAVAAALAYVDTLPAAPPSLTYWCAWTGRPVALAPAGRCVACHVLTWTADKRDPDPRGPTGRYTSSRMHAEEYSMQGPDVPRCFECYNTGDRYRLALTVARGRWTPAAATHTHPGEG